MLKTANNEGKVRKKSMVSFADSPTVIGQSEGNGMTQPIIPDIDMGISKSGQPLKWTDSIKITKKKKATQENEEREPEN